MTRPGRACRPRVARLSPARLPEISGRLAGQLALPTTFRLVCFCLCSLSLISGFQISLPLPRPLDTALSRGMEILRVSIDHCFHFNSFSIGSIVYCFLFISDSLTSYPLSALISPRSFCNPLSVRRKPGTHLFTSILDPFLEPVIFDTL